MDLTNLFLFAFLTCSVECSFTFITVFYTIPINMPFVFPTPYIISDQERLSLNRNITKGNKLLLFSTGDKRIIKTYDISIVQNKQKCMQTKKREISNNIMRL